MKKLILCLLSMCPLAASADNLNISDQLFDYAEKSYPQFFSPSGMETYRLGDFWVRYYPDTNSYIGTLDNTVYVYSGALKSLLKVGEISDFIDIGQANDDILKEAFENHLSDVQVTGSGVLTRLLADDLDGSRHQRFIIQLNSGQTLLIAHNIDLAPRIDNLELGDTVEFYGEYVWNDQGGLIHWTHYDPNGTHPDGWLMHEGILYQSY